MHMGEQTIRWRQVIKNAYRTRATAVQSCLVEKPQLEAVFHEPHCFGKTSIQRKVGSCGQPADIPMLTTAIAPSIATHCSVP
jgi:hypothetical protein